MNIVVFGYGVYALASALPQFTEAQWVSQMGMIPAIGPLNLSSYIVVGGEVLAGALMILGGVLGLKNEKNIKLMVVGLVATLLLHGFTGKAGDAVLDAVFIGLVFYSSKK